MTKNEALQVFHALSTYDVYCRMQGSKESKLLEEIEDFDYERLLDYFNNLKVPFDEAMKFVRCETVFADMNDVVQNDDHDNFELIESKDGKLSLYSWTEPLGIMYDLEDYGIKWTDHEKRTMKQIREDDEKMFDECLDRAFETEIIGCNSLFDDYCKEVANQAIGEIAVDDDASAEKSNDTDNK